MRAHAEASELLYLHQNQEDRSALGAESKTIYLSLMSVPRVLRPILAITAFFIAMTELFAPPEGFNYDEAKVPQYTLPDPLVSNKGTTINTIEQWQQVRRPEILEHFEASVYGRTARLPSSLNITTTSLDSDALGGKATRKQVTLRFEKNAYRFALHVLIYLPNSIDSDVPVFLGYNFNGNHTIHSDPSIHLSTAWMRKNENGNENHQATDAARGKSASRWPVEMIIDRGYGLATAYYGDIEADHKDGWKEGIRSYYKTDEDRNALALEDWSAISAWSWGLSRIMDYFETDLDIDSNRVALLGHSRLGKTSLWAGAKDDRFAITISNDSGCGGAALSRRAFGETVERINTSFPHWFNRAFKQYNGNENALPVDQHQLIALMAPRPVYVASAEEDEWADPNGEFLSAKAAGPVYKLFGLGGVGVESQPPVNSPVGDYVGYHVRTGGHDVTDYDWAQYLKFADRHLKQ